jgi:hypothetical protein
MGGAVTEHNAKFYAGCVVLAYQYLQAGPYTPPLLTST